MLNSRDTRNRWTHTAFGLILLLVFAGGLLQTAKPLYAATLGLTITKLQDGGLVGALNVVGDTANGVNICPANPTAGCDFGATDDIVRTHDQVSYRFNYNVNPPIDNTEDIVITSTLPDNFTWNFLPGSCTGTGSAISADGRTLTCNMGTFTSAATASFDVLVDVGGVANGTVLDFDATIDGTASTAVPANAPDVTVTAAPRYDIRKFIDLNDTQTVNGVLGFVLSYTLELWVLNEDSTTNPLLGTEPLTSTISLTDDISAVSANTELYGCSNVNSPVSPSETVPGRPWAQVGMNGGSASTDNSVVDAGTIACSQPGGAGTDIDITLSGVDSSLNTHPSFSRNGATIATTRYHVGSYYVEIFVPASDVTAAGGNLTVTNCFTDFDPLSITGVSNYGANTENTSNNCQTTSLNTVAGSANKWFVYGLDAGAPDVSKPGNVLVVPGETFASLMIHTNAGLADLTNIILCDAIDNSKYVVTGNSFTDGEYITGGGTVVIEYATGNVGAWPPDPFTSNSAAVNAECSDPGITWVESSVYAGDLADVTKWRARLLDPLLSGTRARIFVEVQALDADPTSGALIPNGTVLANYATGRNDQQNSGNYFTNNYIPGAYPTPSHTNVSFGDRVILARGIVRISKAGSVDAVNAGDTMSWTLSPTFTNDGDGYSSSVEIVDVLPPELSYLVGTASLTPSQIIACTGAGAPHARCTQADETVLVWDLGTLTANDVITPITFSTLVSAETPNNTIVTNNAVISSPSDVSPETDRDASDTVLVQAPAILLVAKTVQTPLILPDEQIQFTLLLRNNTADPLSNLDVIDVLPWNGDSSTGPFGAAPDDYPDGRTPPSDYTGTLDFNNVTLPAGATIYYTKDALATIDRAPVHLTLGTPNTNDLATGSTNWCLGTSGSAVNSAATPTNGGGTSADCPASLAEVTAYRIVWPGPLPADGGSQSFVLLLDTNGNAKGDIYTNNFGTKSNELALPALSNDVSAIVVSPSIGDTVWLDVNQDGVQQVGEIGLEGVTVTLTGTNQNGDPVSLQTTTDAAGHYLFDADTFGLLPSDGSGYTVTIDPTTNTTMPGVTFFQSYDLDDGTGPYATALSSGAVVLGGGDERLVVDFGLYTIPTLIGDFVWNDFNKDGIQGAGEPGIANVTVELQDANGNVIDTTVTDAQGAYTFTVQTAANYVVQIAGTNFVPSGVLYGLAASPLGQQSVGDSTVNASPEFAVTLGTDVLTIDFGFYADGKSTLGDYVWRDNNADGDHTTAAEVEYTNGIDGVILNVYRDVGTPGVFEPGVDILWTTTTTGDDPNTTGVQTGWYNVPVVGQEQYWVQVDPSNFDPGGALENAIFTNGNGSTYPADDPQLGIVATDPSQNLDVDFGYVFPVSVGSFIWEDLNGNGLQDSGEPGIDGAVVTLLVDDGTGTFVAAVDATGATVDPQTVGADGLYFFDNLPEGTYMIEVTVPSGYIAGPVQNDTDDDDTDNDSNIASEAVGVFSSTVLTLTAGAEPTETTGLAGAAQDDGLETNGNMTLDMAFVQVPALDIRKVLNTPEPVRVGDPLSFTITITNTGGTTIAVLPLVDTYDQDYIGYVSATPASVDNTDDGTINWADLTASFGSDLAPGATFQVTVYFTGLRDTTNLANQSTINYAAVSGAEDSNGNTPTDVSDNDDVSVIAPTGVYFADRGASRSGATVELRWTTLDESQIAAFRIVRTNSDGSESVLTAEALAALFAGQPQGSAYSFTDADLSGQSTVHYDLEIIGLDGTVTRLDLGRIHAGATTYLPLVVTYAPSLP